MGFQFQSVASLSSFVISDLGIDYTQLGLLIGFYLLPGIVIAYPSGLLGRRFGDKQPRTEYHQKGIGEAPPSRLGAGRAADRAQGGAALVRARQWIKRRNASPT